jgi:hypothetical protein
MKYQYKIFEVTDSKELVDLSDSNTNIKNMGWLMADAVDSIYDIFD